MVTPRKPLSTEAKSRLRMVGFLGFSRGFCISNNISILEKGKNHYNLMIVIIILGKWKNVGSIMTMQDY